MKVIVAQEGLKLFNGKGYIYPGIGDEIELPDKEGRAEVRSGFVTLVPKNNPPMEDTTPAQPVEETLQPSSETTEEVIEETEGSVDDLDEDQEVTVDEAPPDPTEPSAEPVTDPESTTEG